MGANFKILLYTITSIFFTTLAAADSSVRSQSSVGCTIFSISETETKHICSKTQVSLERVSDLLLLTLEENESFTVQRLILEDEELRQSSLEELNSAIWAIQNCKAEDICSKPTLEVVEQIAPHQCGKEARMYTVYRGLFILDQPPLKTPEIGAAVVCTLHQKLSILISADLFGAGDSIFILLPESAANGEK